MSKEQRTLLWVLISSSIFMFVTLLVGAALDLPKLTGLGILIWIGAVFWSMKVSFFQDDHKVEDVFDGLATQSKEAWKERNFFYAGVTFLAMPMMVVGLIFIVLIILAFFFLL
jgi:hypothetical protein